MDKELLSDADLLNLKTRIEEKGFIAEYEMGIALNTIDHYKSELDKTQARERILVEALEEKIKVQYAVSVDTEVWGMDALDAVSRAHNKAQQALSTIPDHKREEWRLERESAELVKELYDNDDDGYCYGLYEDLWQKLTSLGKALQAHKEKYGG